MAIKYDIIVVGAGIAGLSIAELYSRNNKSVLLIEKNAKIASGASSTHHDWFHLGSLYSLFPSNFYKTFTKNLDTIIKYYNYDNMNISKDETYKIAKDGWFSKNRIDQRVLQDKGFVRNIILSLFKYRINSLKKDWNYLDNINGVDISMNSSLILNDLLNSFLTSGELLLNSEVTSVNEDILIVNGEEIQGSKIIFTTGQALQDLDANIRNVYSPIAIIKPALSNQSFVNISLDKNKTISHIKYDNYSVVSSALFTNNKDTDDIEKQLVKNITRHYDLSNHKVETYIGVKTEYKRFLKNRNYKHFFKKIKDNTYLAIPGKFTLSFQLAVDMFEELEGYKPSTETTEIVDKNDLPIELTKHKKLGLK